MTIDFSWIDDIKMDSHPELLWLTVSAKYYKAE